MVRVNLVSRMVLGGLVAAVCGLGCGGVKKPNKLEVDQAKRNLMDIVRAYGKATADMGHPPRVKDELTSYFETNADSGDPDNPVRTTDVTQVFRSPRDNEDFVICWAFDLRDLDHNPKTWPVWAYEKTGQDGKRYVAQGRFVKLVSNEELADLPFVDGFAKP